MDIKKKTFKEILNDMSFSDKCVAIGLICIMIAFLMLFIVVIAIAYSKCGIACGFIVTLFSMGIYGILIGLCDSWLDDKVDFYDVEWKDNE
jgi:Na+-translocating ferredoxin:NAD+ oxidoreductase RnfD subunit